MNWDRAGAEYRLAQGSGYWDRRDSLDEAWMARESEREERISAVRAAPRRLDKGQRKQLDEVARGMGIALGRWSDREIDRLFANVGADAQRMGLAAGELRRRRLEALRSGNTPSAIIQARRMDGPLRPSQKRPRSKGGPPPVSTKERLKAEAAAKGRSVNGSVVAEPAQSRPTAPTPSPSPGVGKAAKKRAQAEAEASLRGISVEELKRERQAKAQADLTLSLEAKALGMTAKALRAQRSAG